MKQYIIVGLTGQSGARKTMVSKLFLGDGFAVIDCDVVARKVTEKGSDCNKMLAEFFPQCFDVEFSLDRRKMAEMVFSDKDKLDILNCTIFPFITQNIETAVNDLVNKGQRIIVLDAPTLFESGIDKKCDIIVSVVADENIRLKRISERDKIPVSLIKKRFASQLSQDFFIDNSDFVIENNGDLNEIKIKIQGVINKIKERANGNQNK